MKLRKRPTRKTDQALDAAASVTKLWSDWQLGKRAAKGVAKAKTIRQPSKFRMALRSKRLRIVGAVAVLGGAGAAAAKALRGGDPEPIYTGPPPSDAVEAAASAPDAPLSELHEPTVCRTMSRCYGTLHGA